jgi:hypothetical protein
MQSRTYSAFEAGANVVVGYLIGLTAQLTIFPLVGVSASLGQNLVISVFFSLVSLARSYLLRRWFNRLAAVAVQRTAREAELIRAEEYFQSILNRGVEDLADLSDPPKVGDPLLDGCRGSESDLTPIYEECRNALGCWGAHCAWPLCRRSDHA